MVLQGIDQKTIELYHIKMNILNNEYCIFLNAISTAMFNYKIKQDTNTYTFYSNTGSIIIWKDRVLYSTTIY